MSEKQLERLAEQFSEIKNKKIAVYMDGIDGAYSYILETGGLQIIGVMTRYLVKGQYYGYPYLSFEDVVAKKVEVILIATRPVYYTMIYRRIQKFCEKHDIRVFTVEGDELSSETSNQREALPENCLSTKEYCFRQIHNAETVIFDFEHVLATARVLEERDIFELLKRRLCGSGRENWAFEEEQQFRKALLIARGDVVELCRYAVTQGKKVWVLNNTILSNVWVEQWLELYKICGVHVMEQERKDGKLQCGLYFTANKQQKYCEKYIWIPNIREMLRTSRFAEMEDRATSLYSRVKCGLFASRAFNSPFALSQLGDGRITVSESYDIGYLFAAGYITDFMSWFIREMKQYKNAKILFGARDGYLIQKLYDMTLPVLQEKEMPETVYLLISRMVSINMGIYDAKDIKAISEMYFEGDKREMLGKRFFLKTEEHLAYDDTVNSDEYIMAHTPKILTRSQALRERYFRYINRLKLDKYEDVIYFDFAASGTCQVFLQEILEKNLCGYYFYRFSSDDEKKAALNVKAFYDKNMSFETNSLFMECVLTAPHATVIDVTEAGTPVYMKESRSDAQIAYSEAMQTGVMDYYRQMLEIMGDFSDEPRQFVQENEFMKYLYDEYVAMENQEFCDYVVMDEFINIESHVGMMYSHEI